MDQMKGKRLCCDSMLFSFQLIAEGFSNFWAFRWKDESYRVTITMSRQFGSKQTAVQKSPNLPCLHGRIKGTASIKMRETDPSHMKEISFSCSLVINEYKKDACGFRMFERLYLRQRRLFTFVRHYASREVSCGMLTKVCRARINYFKLSRFLHYSLTV